ncbi:MAG: SPOR domain-containing protein [Paracoccaceae bacterium]|nr:SPOR domain-containing protein [Paracoccaceae bacterium]
MAVVNFDDLREGVAALSPERVQRIINLAGAVTSVALILGVAVWGYKLAMRDINGIPVIHAMQGPMRVAPEDPGGQIATNIGLEVNRVAAEAKGEKATDNLVLAPRPVGLTAADLSPEALQAKATADAAAAASAKASAVSAALTATGASVASATSASVASATTPVAPLADGPTPTAPAADIVPASLGGVVRSLVPMPRPATPTTTSAAVAAAMVRAVVDVDPATLKAGTRLVQLGAFDNATTADAVWDRVSAKFGDLMAGKSRVLQTAQSGGRQFVRLRVLGFKNDAASRQFCAALLAENAACVPVLVR